MSSGSIHLTKSDIQEILHPAHWIAAKNGSPASFMSSKYPGPTFADLLYSLIESGRLVKARSRGDSFAHHTGWQPRARITEVDVEIKHRKYE
jgi:hypothetical protein